MLREVSIEVLRKCPNKCLHCSSMSDKYCTEVINYNLFKSVVDDAIKLGAEIICLSGGEPFLHPDVAAMVSYIYEKGAKCYIYSSGIVMNNEGHYLAISNDLLKQISSKVAKIIFNVEAATPETYDYIMGTKNCFEIMKQSIQSAHNFSIVTEAHFVPMKANINEINDTVSLCSELGMSKISFLRLVLHGRAQLNQTQIALSNDEFLILQHSLELLQISSDIEIRIGVPLASGSICQKCEAANGKLNIKYDGYVFPCEVFKNERMAQCLKPLKPDSIYEYPLCYIYHNSQYLKTVRMLSEQYFCSRHCETCVGQYLISKSGDGGQIYVK